MFTYQRGLCTGVRTLDGDHSLAGDAAFPHFAGRPVDTAAARTHTAFPQHSSGFIYPYL